MKTNNWFFITAILWLGFNPFAWTQDLPDAASIVQKTQDRHDGDWVSQDLTFELTDRRGKTRVNVTRAFRKDYGATEKQAIFYQSPTNVKGTAFLTYDYPEQDKDDDQWLYLPALRKTRRISASDKGDYFLGTDLTYEDIKLGPKLSKYDYDYQVIRTEMVEGHLTYLIEGKPKTERLQKELGYSKVQSWVDASIWMIRKAEFWDVAGNHLKSLEVKDIEKIQGIWTAQSFFIKNHKTNHQTRLRFTNIDYQAVVEDGVFTEEALVNGM